VSPKIDSISSLDVQLNGERAWRPSPVPLSSIATADYRRIRTAGNLMIDLPQDLASDFSGKRVPRESPYVRDSGVHGHDPS